MPEDGMDLPGIGPTLMKRLERALDGREGVVAALDRGDVVALSGVPGISRERAVRIVQAHRGEDVDWLMTDNAEVLGRDAVQPFLARAVTPMARAILETLAPTTDEAELKARLDEAGEQVGRLAKLDLDPVRGHLRRITQPATPRPKPVRDVTILLDEGPLADGVRDEGLDRWVDVAIGEEPVSEAGLVLAATLQDAPRGAIHITPGKPWEVVPWADLAWAAANRELLEALSSLSDVLQLEDAAAPILLALEGQGAADEAADLEGAAAACIEEANARLEAELETLTLSGKDVLEVLQGGASVKVERIVGQVHAEASKRFRDTTGLSGAPFTDTYPLQLDNRELHRLEREVHQDQALGQYRAAVEVARAVRSHRDALDEMVRHAIELDRWQAVATTARELGLALPTLGKTFAVTGALHLSLEGDGEPVDYPVPTGVALLTGANSGGKTTLLETLGQIAYLAHLGLPVPAKKARVPVLDGLAYYARPRQLGAGAFEGFLRTIEEVLLSDERVLVLADELEAMTELDAASAILAEVVARLQARKAPAVLVTHLAPFILPHVTEDVRVDGIEATGLDDDNELVVERTPKIGEVARSTPELILQRLRNQADGDRRELYESMLRRLEPAG